MSGKEVGGGPGEWVLLSYHLPREPSTPRIATWRRFRRLGVAQLSDGLIGLPADARTREQLGWIADDIQAAGGTAGVWLARPTTSAQEQELAAAMAADRAAEYGELARDAHAALATPDADLGRISRRLREQWRRITRRDFFPPLERDVAQSALGELLAAHGVDQDVDGRAVRP